jgi:hypothetical protein
MTGASDRRVLFIVNGLGMGNSTRSDSIMQHLRHLGYVADILTSGNGLRYFREHRHKGQLFSFGSLAYGDDASGNLSIPRTLMSVPSQLRTYISNVLFLRSLLKKRAYCAIVIDSDYTVLWARPNVPIIALNNADIVVAEIRRRGTYPRSIRLHLLIERLDYLFHRCIPDLILSPSIISDEDAGRFRHFPPFVRPGLTPSCASPELRNLLVMLSGSQFASRADFVNKVDLRGGIRVDVVGRDGESSQSIRYHGSVLDNMGILQGADAMVINAGFSAVSEAVVMGKPMVVIPIENHAEQHINAKLIEESGLGLMASIETAPQRLEDLIRRFPEFQAAHKEFNASTDGAEMAARAMVDFLEKQTVRP